MAKVKNLLIMGAFAASAQKLSGGWVKTLDLSGTGRGTAYNHVTNTAFTTSDAGVRVSTNNASSWTAVTSPTTATVGAYVGGSMVFAAHNLTEAYVTSDDGVTWQTVTYSNPNVIMSHISGGTSSCILYNTEFSTPYFLRFNPSTSTFTDISAVVDGATAYSFQDCAVQYLRQQAKTMVGCRNGRYLFSSNNNTFTEVTITSVSISAAIDSIVETNAGRCIITAGERVYYSDNITSGSSWVQAFDLSTYEPTTLWGVGGSCIASSSDSDLTVIGARQTGASSVAVSSDNGVSWNVEQGVNGVDSGEYATAISYAGNNTFFQTATGSNNTYRGVYS